MCTSMFTSALSTITKTCNQNKCPLIAGWIKKIWHIFTMDYNLAIKKNEIILFSTL